jgi:hypothetical protein
MGTRMVELLQDANPTKKLREQYFITKYPYAKGVKVFKPIQIFAENSKTIKVVNGFREIAEERRYNYYKDHKLVTGNPTRDLELVHYMLSTLSDVDRANMFNWRSILGKEIKDNYYHNMYKFEQQIVNYTQLRDMVLYYLAFKSGRRVVQQDQIMRMVDSLPIINGLYPEDSDKIREALEEYRRVLREVQDAKARLEAEEQLKWKTEVPENAQLTIGDIYPELAGDIEPVQRKGRVKDLLNN